MSYRAGIIGCGSISAAHARGYQGTPGIELVAAADPVERARTGIQAQFSIPRIYADAEEMLREEKLDFVSICLWHPLHAPFTLQAARHQPKAILCEKPMATCLAEADAMLAACDEQGVKLVIGHQRRYNHSWTRARQLLADGAIGEPRMVNVQTGEGLLNCGTHVVDAIRYLTGDPATEWVFGAVERQSDRFERNVCIEDCCMGLIQFVGGVQALVQCDLTGTSNVENYTVTGSDGILEVGQRSVRWLRGGGGDWQTEDTGYDDPWVLQAQAALAWVEGAADGHRGEGRQARRTLEILMGIYQSARERAVVRMPLAVGAYPLGAWVDEGGLPVTQPGRYDIRLFLSFDPEQKAHYQEQRRAGRHPREILREMGF